MAQVKAFVVEKDNPGYAASKIEGKVSLRMVQNADITLVDCRVSENARARRTATRSPTSPRCSRAPATPLPGDRPGMRVAAYDIALNYAQRRTQFGRLIAKSR